MFDIYNLLFPFFDGNLFHLILEGKKIEPIEIIHGKLNVTPFIDFRLK